MGIGGAKKIVAERKGEVCKMTAMRVDMLLNIILGCLKLAATDLSMNGH